MSGQRVRCNQNATICIAYLEYNVFYITSTALKNVVSLKPKVFPITKPPSQNHHLESPFVGRDRSLEVTINEKQDFHQM